MSSITNPVLGCAEKHHRLLRRAFVMTAAPLWAAAYGLSSMFACAADNTSVATETVTQLMSRDLLDARGKEVLMITVTYLPGGASLPHRHDAQVFVYVLEGALTMQLKGGTPVTLRPGQTFYEGPNDIHQVSANASRTAPAKILVFMVKDKAREASRDVTPKEVP